MIVKPKKVIHQKSTARVRFFFTFKINDFCQKTVKII